MNWIDIAFLVFIVYTILSSFRGGAFKTFLDIIAVFVAVYFASYIASLFIAPPTRLLYLYFYTFLFIAVYIGMSFLLYVLGKVVKINLFLPIDLLIAAVFGLIKGMLIAGLFIILLSKMPLPAVMAEQISPSITNKVCAPLMYNTYKAVFERVPKDEKYIKEDVGTQIFKGASVEGQVLDDETIKEVMPAVQKEFSKRMPTRIPSLEFDLE